MFMGQYEHTIDEKGRLMIPVKFRESLGDGAVITRGFEQNLMVLTPPAFEATTRRIEELSVTLRNARLLQRQIFGFAQQVALDKLGRILIPAFLRDTAELKESVIVVGMSNFFEVWSPEQWQKQMLELTNPEADEQRFAAFNLPIG